MIVFGMPARLSFGIYFEGEDEVELAVFFDTWTCDEIFPEHCRFPTELELLLLKNSISLTKCPFKLSD